jgi:hypothetical protein
VRNCQTPVLILPDDIPAHAPVDLSFHPYHGPGDPILYALETDWPVGAAGFEPLHIRIGICQDSQPRGRDSNLRISN